jgi:hypothetical protein
MKELFKKSKTLTLLIASFATVMIGHNINQYNLASDKVIQVGQSNNGLITCFQRITQTYTAWTIGGSGSAYTGKSFGATTESCLAEVNTAMETLGIFAAGTLEKMNRTLTDVHWFNNKINKSFDDKSPEATSAVKEKFNRIDSNVEYLWDNFDTQIATLEAGKSEIVNQLGISISIAFVSLAMLFAAGIIGYRSKNEIENNADRFYTLKDYKQNAKIDGVISSALTESGYTKTATLFKEYHEDLLDRSVVTHSYSEAAAPQKILNIDLTPETISLNIIADKVYESISPKIFSSGILFDMEMDNNIHVAAEEEQFHQLLHSVFTYGVEAAQSGGDKKARICTKVLGDILYVKLNISGACYNSSELESNNVENINFMVLSEMMKDMNGTIVIKNIFEDSNSQAVVELTLREIASIKTDAIEEAISTKKVTSVVKGSKKEILKSFSEAVS